MCFSDFATGPEPEAGREGWDEELALARREGVGSVVVWVFPLAEADRFRVSRGVERVLALASGFVFVFVLPLRFRWRKDIREWA